MKRKKESTHVLILTQYYPPETGAPQNRLSDLAKRFKNDGYDVIVLTAKPNYPLGKIYPGFNEGFSQVTLQDEIPVIHCWIYPSNRSIFHRLINYFSFVLSSIIVGCRRLANVEMIIVESPPLFLSISGWVLSRLKGAKLVLNISDLYPETAIALGFLKNGILITIFYWLEAWAYHKSALVTCQTQGILDNIKKRFPKQPLYLLTNGMSFELLHEMNPLENCKEPVIGEDFIIGYAGILGYGQNLQVLINSALNLKQFQSIRIHIYGDGPQRTQLAKEISDQGLQNITLLGHHPHLEILNIMRSWNVGLVSLVDNQLMTGALPSKMFEMMAMKLPILLIAPKGEASAIIEEANAGVCVDPNSADRISDAILTFYIDDGYSKELGENGYRFVKDKFNRKLIFKKFVSYLLSQGLLTKN